MRSVLQACALVGGERGTDGIECECTDVIDACVEFPTRLCVAGDIVVRPDHIARLPDALGMGGIVLIGKVEVVVAVGEERLVVAVHHHDDGAVEITQLFQEGGEGGIGRFHERAVFIGPGDNFVGHTFDGKVQLLVGGHQARVIGGVVLHRHVVDEDRLVALL